MKLHEVSDYDNERNTINDLAKIVQGRVHELGILWNRLRQLYPEFKGIWIEEYFINSPFDGCTSRHEFEENVKRALPPEAAKKLGQKYEAMVLAKRQYEMAGGGYIDV